MRKLFRQAVVATALDCARGRLCDCAVEPDRELRRRQRRGRGCRRQSRRHSLPHRRRRTAVALDRPDQQQDLRRLLLRRLPDADGGAAAAAGERRAVAAVGKRGRSFLCRRRLSSPRPRQNPIAREHLHSARDAWPPAVAAAVLFMPQWRIVMPRYPRVPRTLALALLFVAMSLSEAAAHCFVGARFFPATLAIDDPCVADEMSLPTVSWSKTGDVPPASEWDVSAEIIETHHRGFRHLDRRHLDANSSTRRSDQAGFSDLETTLQYQLLKNDAHELAHAARADRRLGRHRRQQFRNRHAL